MRDGGNVYNVPISAAALSSANTWDVFTLTASSSGRFEIVRIEAVLQSTTVSAIGFQLLTGSTGVSTGAAITPVNVKRYSGNKSADFTATNLSSTVVSTTSAALVYAAAIGGLDGRWVYAPSENERPLIGLSGTVALRTSIPSVAAVVSATVTIREMGKGLPS